MRTIDRIVIHCTSAPVCVTDAEGNVTHSPLRGSRRGSELRKQLLATFRQRGWKNPGYHIVVDELGERIDMLPVDKVANGAKGFNQHSIHIAYHGGCKVDSKGKLVTCDTRTPLQKLALRDVVAEMQDRFPKAVVLGHRDLSPDLNKDGKITKNEWIKDCPSFDVKTEL